MFLEFTVLLIEMYKQEWTNVLQIYKPCLSSRRQKKGYVVHVPYWRYTNNGCKRTKFILHRDVTPGIFAPLNTNKTIRRFLILTQTETILSRGKRLVYSYTIYIIAGVVRQSGQVTAHFATILADVLFSFWYPFVNPGPPKTRSYYTPIFVIQ